jgi:TonB family protein
MEGWNDYLKENLRYPASAKEKKVEGTVYVIFVVDKEGITKNPEILRGVGAGLDEEAMRVIQESPAWTPGMQHGTLVNVKLRMPIRFRLPESYVGQDDRLEELKTANIDWKNGNILPSEAFHKHIQRNIKYPIEARREGVTGTVITKLIFDSKGNITDLSIVKGPNKSLNEEVLRQLSGAPAWEVVNGKESYQAVYPITFKLDNESVKEPDYRTVLGKGAVVVGYGTQSGNLNQNPRSNGIISINVINDRLVNFNGKILTIDANLPLAIKAILEENGFIAAETTAQLSAASVVKMGTIQDVQQALKSNNITRLLYTNSRIRDKQPKTPDATILLENQPLVILDGVVNASIEEINPTNIESVSVLKDKKAVSLYGAAAKNGVIIVTTKK